MIRKSAPGLARLLFACAFMVSQAPAANKMAFLTGGRSHGPGAHEFCAGGMLLAKALNVSGPDIQAGVHHGWLHPPQPRP